jgi:hypothetical protein
MEIMSEKEETMCRFDIDMSNEEILTLQGYYRENCPDKDKMDLEINWAIVDILKNKITEGK